MRHRLIGQMGDVRERLHRLIYEIEDLSDEVRDCARDKQYDAIPTCFAELKKRWELLLNHVNRE